MAVFDEVADVSFLGDITPASLKAGAEAAYKEEYEAITGESANVSAKTRAVIYAMAALTYQVLASSEERAKQNLLKYATGEYLDNKALNSKITRKEAESAAVAVTFYLSETAPKTVIIPKGTRVTTADKQIYFATDEYREITPEEGSADILCTALTATSAADTIAAGEINILADPIAYVSKVENALSPEGGTDTESDEDLRERVYESRNVFSTAGSEGAYKYYTKSYSTLIDDVKVKNPADAEIEIYVLSKDREDFSGAFLEGLLNYLNDTDIRPLTDNITVKNAETVEYAIDASYTIYETDSAKVEDIKAAVEAAAEEYAKWQSEKIGRDINPQKLIALMIDAGAAAVTINAPEFRALSSEQAARLTGEVITYTGLTEE